MTIQLEKIFKYVNQRYFSWNSLDKPNPKSLYITLTAKAGTLHKTPPTVISSLLKGNTLFSSVVDTRSPVMEVEHY